jgi:uncharacterized protein with PQ loop repeat
MNQAELEQVDPALEMENLEHAVTEMSEAASNLDYWSGLLVQLLTFGSEMAMVFGGVMPYVPQYLQIQAKQTTQGFSLYVCLALLMANTLRIIFWFGNHFETPLLIQSILMNLTMFALIHLCVKISNKEYFAEKRKGRHFTDFDPDYFWRWTDFLSYLEFVMSVALLGSLLMYFLIDFPWFVESVGFMAVFTEACLGVPQFYRNFKNKSTYGMSLPMVIMWTCGDIFKTTYFVLRKTPPQFFICGSLQVTVDILILAQVWFYRLDTEKRKRSELGRGL